MLQAGEHAAFALKQIVRGGLTGAAHQLQGHLLAHPVGVALGQIDPTHATRAEQAQQAIRAELTVHRWRAIQAAQQALGDRVVGFTGCASRGQQFA